MSNSDIGTIRINLLADIGGLTSGISKATTQLERWSRKTSEQLDKVGKSFTRNLTLPLTAIGGAALAASASFERSMNRVDVLTGATREQFRDLSEVAKQLGASTQFSASQAAEGMGFLAMAGLNVQQVLGALPDTLNLAAAAQMDLARSADLVTNIMSGFQIETADLGQAVDVLTKAFVSSNTDLAQLGEAFKIAGPVAKGAGFEFEEAAAALALMASSGFQASLGGTALRGTISRLLGSLEDGNDVLDKLGVRVKGVDGGLRSLHEIVRDLERSGAGAADMMALFGERAGPAMIALVGQGSNALAEMTKKLRDSGGTAERVATVQMRGLHGAFTELKSAAEGLLISIGETGLLDVATQATKVTTGLVRKLDNTSDTTKATTTAVLGLAAATGPALIGVGLSAKALGSMAKGAKAAKVAMMPMMAATAGLGIVAAKVGTALASFEVGRYFHDEFQIVQQVAAEFVAMMDSTLARVEGLFTIGVPRLKQFILEQIRDLIQQVQSISQGVQGVFEGTVLSRLPQPVQSAYAGLSAVADATLPSTSGITSDLNQAIIAAGKQGVEGARAMQERLAMIEAVRLETTTRAIPRAFGGGDGRQSSDRKGGSFQDFLSEDLRTVGEKLTSMTAGITGSMDEVSASMKRVGEQASESSAAISNAFKGIDGIDDAKEKIDDVSRSLSGRLLDGVEGWSREVSQAFTDMVWDGERSFNQLAESFGRMLTRMLFQELAIAPIVAGIRTAVTPAEANAKGNAFSGGRVVPFAKGGVVTGPRTFPMRGGRTGLMGEAGPEAIMPLTRTAGGGLGVRASGGVSVTIVDQRSSGARPEVSESTDGNGRKRLTIMLRDEVRAMMGDGSLDRTMRANYGLGRAGVGR